MAIDFRNWGIPLGRRFRSLKIFFVLRSFGVEGFRSELRRTIELTDYLHRLVEEDEWFEPMLESPSLALTMFRMKPNRIELMKQEGMFWPSNSNDQASILNTLNQRLEDLIQSTNQIAITATVIDGQRGFRFSVGRMSKRHHIDHAWNLFKSNSEEVKRTMRLDSQVALKLISSLNLNSDSQDQHQSQIEKVLEN